MKELSLKTRLFNGARLIFRNRVAESILFSFTKGKKWNQAIAKIPANYYQYPKGSWRKAERNGFQLSLDISDYMQWLLYFGILAEPRETLYDLVKPDMTVLDIGANIGETSLMFSRITGKEGRVISFEPDPDTFLHLQQHIRDNHCENIQAINKGLGKEKAELVLEEVLHNSGGHRIASEQDSNGKKISIAALDELAGELLLSKIDFIKIDVEGYEYHVLEGAKNTIRQFRPLLFIEMVDDFLLRQKVSSALLVQMLHNENYALKNAEDGSPVVPGMDFSGTHFDLIATPHAG